jgi:hypothetical protein
MLSFMVGDQGWGLGNLISGLAPPQGLLVILSKRQGQMKFKAQQCPSQQASPGTWSPWFTLFRSMVKISLGSETDVGAQQDFEVI